jgi:two-component system cell cycle response regulator DivK
MADVLIIDDDPDNAQALAEILRANGHQVRIGYDGREGLRLASERMPELALLDVEMPKLDGPGLAYEMYVHDMGLEDIPVAFLSAVTNLPEVARAAGTTYYLSKPFRYPQLMALVNRALRERTPPRRPEGPRHP